jgi:hypothetical protein
MPTDFGSDILVVNGDLDPYFRVQTGPIVLAQALVRRLTNQFLWYAPGETTDLRQLLRGPLSNQQRFQLKTLVEQMCELDQRVQRAMCGVDYDAASETMTLTIMITTASGPFTMIASVDSLNVKLLGIR